jgi:hypothetical protein
MAGFDEAWLRDYIQRRAAVAPVAPCQSTIKLKLARPTILLNPLLRMHWRARRMLAASISAELARQLSPNHQPFERARVTITRYSIKECDEDNLRGCKIAIDCLLPYSARHPHGLGLVRDDDRAHMEQVMISVVVATMREQRTEIVIEPLGAATAQPTLRPSPAG